MNAVEAPDGKESVLEADHRHPATAEVHGLDHCPLVRDGVVLLGGTQAFQAREPASHVDLACWEESGSLYILPVVDRDSFYILPMVDRGPLYILPVGRKVAHCNLACGGKCLTVHLACGGQEFVLQLFTGESG